MLLTKTNFVHFIDCPCRLWVEKMYPKLMPPVDASLQRIFDQGNLVDDKARELFPGGFEVQGYNYEGWDNTRKVLTSGASVLYQPTVIAGNLSCRSDILVRSGDGWELHEVKSSTSIKEEHYYDVAFQKLCFEMVGVKIKKVFLTYINSAYVRNGAIDISGLLIDEDITETVIQMTEDTQKLVLEAQKCLEWGKELKPEHLNACNNPANCEWIELWARTLNETDRAALYEGTVPSKLREDLPLHIDREGIKAEIEKLEYPLYFFDYETYSDPIPPFDGYRPYQQIPFQFSVYIIEHPGATPQTHDFLMETFEDPVPPLLQAFKGVMGTNGTVISWFAPFEKTRNEEMAQAHPEYADLLNSVNERTYDLMSIFKKGLYVNPLSEGSNSIKKIMPVLVPELSYKNLTIQEGGTASASWPIVTNAMLPVSERDTLRRDMLDYCRLDVYAMVKILDALKALV